MQQEQKRDGTEQKNFGLFVGCAKAATAQGLNVAPNRTNFEIVREAIDDQAQDFNVENVMAMLFRGGLALALMLPKSRKSRTRLGLYMMFRGCHSPRLCTLQA
jgi:hypothetical protein